MGRRKRSEQVLYSTKNFYLPTDYAELWLLFEKLFKHRGGIIRLATMQYILAWSNLLVKADAATSEHLRLIELLHPAIAREKAEGAGAPEDQLKALIRAKQEARTSLETKGATESAS